MIDIVHFHPSKKMANIFVKPLQYYEKKLGYNSKIFTNKSKIDNAFLRDTNLLHILNLITFFAKNKPPLIISHNSISSTLVLFLGRLFNTKKIIYFNHGIPYLGYTGFIRSILLLVEKMNCFLAHQIITVSEDMRVQLNKITHKKIILINNGSACGVKKILKKNRKNHALKKKKGKTIFLVGFIGRTNKRKGFNFTIKLWKKYFANNDEFKLYIFGNTIGKPSNLSHINNIFFKGFSTNLNKYYPYFDCVVTPSLHEGLSYSSIEANQYYCPVIANDIPGIREIIVNNKNGFLIKEPNVDEYAKKILDIKNKVYKNFPDHEFCDFVEEKFNRTNFLKHYGVFIKKVLNN